MKFKVSVSYDGSDFHGWAIQKNQISVQQTIEEALSLLLNKQIKIEGSGRTDSYVHAINQIFSFSVDLLPMDKKNFIKSLNKILPKSININSIQKVSDGFHARYSAKSKTYIYVINIGKLNIFSKDYLLNYNKKLDFKKINLGKNLFIGTHNFLSFSTSKLENTIRTINSIKITKKNNLVYVKISGNGFLRNMVRMIIGCLIDLNENKKQISDIKNLLDNPKKGSSITKAPGCGLYLYKVSYK